MKEKERIIMNSCQSVETKVGNHGTFHCGDRLQRISSTVKVETVVCPGCDRQTQENDSNINQTKQQRGHLAGYGLRVATVAGNRPPTQTD